MRTLIVVLSLFAIAAVALGFTAGDAEPTVIRYRQLSSGRVLLESPGSNPGDNDPSPGKHVLALGMMSPQAGGEPVTPQASLADQLVALLQSAGLDGMATISKIGFGGDAGTRWREALEDAEVSDAKVKQALVLVDALIAKAQNDSKMLTSSVATKPLPVKPSKPKSATVSAPAPAPAIIPAPLTPDEPAKPSAPVTAPSPVGWASAEIVTPAQLRPGDIIAVYSTYQFVLHQDSVPVSSPLPDAPTFWRMGMVFRIESDAERFGMSMDYAPRSKERSAWTVVAFSECLEIRRFGNVPYPVK